jgi:hypothetical protein
MLFRPTLFAYVAFGLAFAAAGSSLAQTDRSFPACPSQQGVEQVVGSQGRFVPSDCRQLTITRVQSGTAELCVLNFEPGGDPGFLTGSEGPPYPPNSGFPARISPAVELPCVPRRARRAPALSS